MHDAGYFFTLFLSFEHQKIFQLKPCLSVS